MFRIREVREQRGLSMREVSRLLNIPYTTYVGYEKEQREPTSEFLIQLADFYDTTVDYLVGRDCSPTISHRPAVLPTPAPDLSREESELLRKYRLLDAAGRGRVQNVLDYEYELRPGKQAKTAATSA